MRAAIFHEEGAPDVVHVEDVATPRPGPGEALIQVKAAAMNHLDLWVRRGLPVETVMPHIGGSDVAGIVAELGAGPGVGAAAGNAGEAGAITVGDRVVINPTLFCGQCAHCCAGEQPLCDSFRILGEHTQGGFAEYVVAPVRNLYRVPGDVEWTTAAAVPLVFQTAWRGLIGRARLRAGESVLVTGASGGVSTAALQIAKLAGARPIYAVTTAANVERARDLGADVVYDREAVDFSRELWKHTGKRGVDVVFDSVGQATWTANLRVLAKGGRLVAYGATTGARAETDIRLLFWRQLQVIGTTMANVAEFETVMDLVFAGRLRPVIDVIWPLDSAADAHARLEAGEAFGKIVLQP